MAEVETAADRRQSVIEADAARLAAEYGEQPAEEPDREEAAPGEPVESEAEVDGALAVDENAEEEESYPEGAPESDDDAEVVDWEKRYKDTQTYVEETNAANKQLETENQALREDQSKAAGEIAQAKYELTDRIKEVENTGQFFLQQAMGDLQRLQQTNVQQLTQEQYQQWQRDVASAQQRAAFFQQGIQQMQERSNKALEEARRREAAIARRQLEPVIPDFQKVYPEILNHAVKSGVNPKVAQELTDPGLIRLLYKAMQDSQQPDIIETVETKTKAKKQKARHTKMRDERGRFKKLRQNVKAARTSAERRAAIIAEEQARLEREYSR